MHEKMCGWVHVSSEIPGIRSAHQAAALQLKISDREGGDGVCKVGVGMDG